MTILFRADASMEMGTGHVMRCAALAQALMDMGQTVALASRLLPIALHDWLEQRGIRVIRLRDADELDDWDEFNNILAPEKPEWLVVDHYGLDATFERKARSLSKRILVIDDLANRPHDCDMLVDHNLYNAMATRYDGLIPTHCLPLLGPRYALLRDEFSRARHGLNRSSNACTRLLVSFGGSDANNMTAKALQAIQSLDMSGMHADVILGMANPHAGQIEALAAGIPGVRCHRHVDHMAECMAQADLFIGAGGGMTWERCCLGLPSIVVAIAGNQEALSEVAHKEGLLLYLGPDRAVSSDDIAVTIRTLQTDRSLRTGMSQRALARVDGTGCQRVATALLEFDLSTGTIGSQEAPALEETR